MGGRPGNPRQEKQPRPVSGLGFQEESRSSGPGVSVGSAQLTRTEDYAGTEHSWVGLAWEEGAPDHTAYKKAQHGVGPPHII